MSKKNEAKRNGVNYVQKTETVTTNELRLFLDSSILLIISPSVCG